METSYLQDQIKDTEDKILEAKTLYESSNDENIKKLAQEELLDLENQKQQLKKALEAPNENNSEKNTSSAPTKKDPRKCIMEIRAGAGGNEAGLFANDLYTIYQKFCEKMKWQTSEISKNQGGIGNIKEVVFEIGPGPNGPGPFKLLRHESGTHRVQRVPSTESSGRIHTSTATVAVLPIVEDSEVEIRPEDLRIDTYKSGGAGGQHVNKTESAVRITHIPTGLVVQCQDERSQHKNKERAMSVLQSRLFQLMQDQQAKSLDDIRANQIGTADRSEKIRTYNFPQDRLTDHRLKQSWHNLEKILMGEIMPILKSLQNLED